MNAQEGVYDQNALRVDHRRGTIVIVQGVSETTVLKVGAFRAANLAGVLSPSPNAVAEAKTFERDYLPGAWITSLGIATLGAAIGSSRVADLSLAVPIGLTISGISLIVYGGRRLDNAYRALSKSVWWYNRDLTKK